MRLQPYLSALTAISLSAILWTGLQATQIFAKMQLVPVRQTGLEDQSNFGADGGEY
jgi:hypothetical protein